MQPREVVNTLRDGVAFRCDPAKTEWGEDFAGAYDWIARQMDTILGPGPDDTRWPVWAWARMSGRNGPMPRLSWHMVPADSRLGGRVSWPRRDARELRWLALDVDPARVLLSDFDLWHSVLNDTYCVPRAQWDDDAVWEKVWTPAEIEDSWQRAFDVSGNCPDVQACLWEVRPVDVTATYRWWSPRVIRCGQQTPGES